MPPNSATEESAAWPDERNVARTTRHRRTGGRSLFDGLLTRPAENRFVFRSGQVLVKLVARPAPWAKWSYM